MSTNTIPTAAEFDLSELDAQYGAPDTIYANDDEDANWRIRVIVEIDYDTQITDFDIYGQFEWVDSRPSYGYGSNRPDGFDGRARKLCVNGDAMWWQPSKDLADEHLAEEQRIVMDLLNYGYIGVVVVVEERTPTRAGEIWADVGSSSLWGIEAMADRSYLLTVAGECLGEALDAVPVAGDAA